MTMQNRDRALSALVGQSHALFMVLQTLVKTHPNPDALANALGEIELIGPAKLETSAVSDAAVGAYYDTISAIRRSLGANPSYSPDQT
jgi:hypothetical protein